MPDSAHRDRSVLRPSVAAFALAVITLAAYAPALGNGFAYDDVAVIQADERVHSFTNVGSILGGGYWQDADLALYRPLTTLSFALDWSIAPDVSAWFHFTNIVLHAAVVVLVFLLLARFFAVWPALLGALVFALHPVHVEAVANVVGRAEMLSALFMLGACLLWLDDDAAARGTHNANNQTGGGRARSRLVWIAVFFVLAMLSKESAVMLPALLVLLDGAHGALKPGNIGSWLRSRAATFAMLAVLLVGYLGLRAVVLGGIAPTRVDPLFEVAATPGARILTALQAWPVWLRLLLFPDVLLADYGPRVLGPVLAFNADSLLGLLIAVAAIGFGVLAWVRGAGRTTLILLWLPIAILPVSNLIVPIGVIVAERTLYLPSFAVAAAVAALAGVIADANLSAAARRAVVAATAVVLTLLTVRTVTRIPVWDSTESVMLALVRDRPDAFRGQWHLARVARAEGDVSRAVARYLQAFELWPYRERLVMEAARYAAEQNRREPAYDLARWAAARWPSRLDTQRLLAGTSLDVGDTATARAALEAGLAIDPTDDVLNRMRVALDSMQQTLPESP